eukprot:10402790-Ditylum_brightwellii.AAC.1
MMLMETSTLYQAQMTLATQQNKVVMASPLEWLTGAALSKTPECYQYTKEDAVEHIKAHLDGNYSAWNVFHEVLKSFIGAAHEYTKKNV